MLQGGCFCGRIRYEVAGRPFHETKQQSVFLDIGKRDHCDHHRRSDIIVVENAFDIADCD